MLTNKIKTKNKDNINKKKPKRTIQINRKVIRANKTLKKKTKIQVSKQKIKKR